MQRVDLDCGGDEDAIRTVTEHADGRAMEIWKGARCVKTFERSGKPNA
jgi:hypothetical protein